MILDCELVNKGIRFQIKDCKDEIVFCNTWDIKAFKDRTEANVSLEDCKAMIAVDLGSDFKIELKRKEKRYWSHQYLLQHFVHSKKRLIKHLFMLIFLTFKLIVIIIHFFRFIVRFFRNKMPSIRKAEPIYYNLRSY
jgi:hypothetical protein